MTTPDKTIVSIKRFMGLRYDEADEEVDRAAYNVVKAPGTGLAMVEVDGKKFTPQEISARYPADAQAPAPRRCWASR